jgi:hypothetical protein
MPRTAITATRLTPASEINAASQAIDVANGHAISLPTADALGQSKGKVNLLVLRIVNTFAGAKIVTIRANTGPVAGTDFYAPFHPQAAKGDLTFSMAQNEVSYITGLDASRFAQDDGKLNIDYEASMTGTIECYCLPDPAV